MCILFLYINPKPSAGNFRLILAANRDEIYKRPAKSAHYWEEDKTVIGGRDLEPGKEGGSWLALSTRGRIAALLNIMHIGEHPQELLGRGSLVSEFVKSKQCGAAYLSTIAKNSHQYRPFNFLTIEIDPESINVHKYCNAGEAPKPECLSDEYLGISNSFIDTPFAKVTAGIQQFKDIISKYGSADEKKSLHNELTKFLKEETSHFPDSVMASFAPAVSTEYLKPYSSVYVNVPERGYGTRAHTIITVDANNRADFNEWSMQDPIDPKNPQWQNTHFSITLSDQ
ncbi:hypothetical protein R5R35_014152 [Gryllus longicercus]|uniref:Transport and Golgi organization protein 2 homolog n=1 Tax=Gryllus longicercus TaxID=2509291 RepID=A0AAN9V932_9ORTH